MERGKLTKMNMDMSLLTVKRDKTPNELKLARERRKTTRILFCSVQEQLGNVFWQ